ncbi:hypothetical protein [Bosea sp. TAF32]|uniref:hypothetical protein n=1 Tax=Bosea sp. TAF32 TaxID=3237482 RepID=UPI003F8EC473
MIFLRVDDGRQTISGTASSRSPPLTKYHSSNRLFLMTDGAFRSGASCLGKVSNRSEQMPDADPFAILEDTQAISRAAMALEIAWNYVEVGIAPADKVWHRRRMQFVVISLALDGGDDATELAHRVMRRFQKKPYRRT